MTMFMRLLRSAAQKHGLCILVCVSFRSIVASSRSQRALMGEALCSRATSLYRC